MTTKKEGSGQASCEKDAGNFMQQLLLLSVVQSLQNAQAELQQLSHFDPLTQLPNRTHFESELNREVARALRFDRKLALLYVDVDYFKKINDTLGHETGDKILKEIALRLRTVVRTEDLVARISGDEFVAILTEISSPHDAGIVAHRVVDAMKKPIEIDGHRVVASVSLGIVCYPEGGRDGVNLYKNAGIALSSAKALGRNNYQFFTSDLHEKHSKRLELEAELHFALERNEFFLEYQPRFELQTQKMVGMEVLLRWQHPERGIISPNDFIPIAEETGLIIPIGKWVISAACKQYAEWRNKYRKLTATLAINVSPKQFQQSSFINYVMHEIDDNHIAPYLLELEITETALTSFLGSIESNLFQLRHFGVQFSIDDFGTGYSSLSRLKELPIQAIKIDRSFVNDIDVKLTDNVIIKSTLVLAKDMGLNVIAEGVETESQMRFLESNQCPQAQGYFYSKPLSVEKMEEFIKTHVNEKVI